MLREDVVAAVKAGTFTVHAISTIDEGLALLTGLTADAVKTRVEARLKSFADRAKAFGADKASAGADDKGAIS